MLNEAVCLSCSAYGLGKGTNPYCLHTAKIIGQAGFFSLSIATNLGEGKLVIQTSCFLLKSYLVLYLAGCGKVVWRHEKHYWTLLQVKNVRVIS